MKKLTTREIAKLRTLRSKFGPLYFGEANLGDGVVCYPIDTKIPVTAVVLEKDFITYLELLEKAATQILEGK